MKHRGKPSLVCFAQGIGFYKIFFSGYFFTTFHGEVKGKVSMIDREFLKLM